MLPLVAFQTGGETVQQRPSQQPARGETGHVLVLDQDRAVAAAVTDLLRTHGLAFGPPARASAPVNASYAPMFAHLALVLLAGVYLPAPLVAWFQSVAVRLG